MVFQLRLLAAPLVCSLTSGVWAQGFVVVVAGSGDAGLFAAIMAKEAGASVVVLEKQACWGGNTNFASGGMNAAGTKQQLSTGITHNSSTTIR